MSQVVPDKPLRVVVWSTGTVGRHAIRGVLAHPDLELVGVWTSTQAKDGRDVGELAGIEPVGIAASASREDVLALAPDAIVHAAMTDDRVFEAIEDLTDFLRHGIDVVSSGPVVLCHPWGTLPGSMIETIETAGRDHDATLHVNGIDPGFANDVLPLVLSSLSRRIDHVRVSEIADYATYDQPVVMRDLFGFGRPMADQPFLFSPGILASAWGPVVRAIAAGLDVTLDEPLTEEVERLPAAQDVSTASVDIAAGTQAAVRFRVVGTVGGVPRITLEHVTRTSPDQAPAWPSPDHGDGCYRIEYDGDPAMRLELTHHGEDGDHNVSGMVITAMRLVNAIPAVVAARPGLLTAAELPLVTGRGLVTA